MIFLNATINNLNQTILYHQQQIEETQNQLDQVKVSATYGEEASVSVEEAIANISSEHLELLKEHLLSLFDKEEVFTSPEPAVFNPPQPDIPHTPEMNEEQHLVKLSDNVIYDQDTDCIHIGFRLSSDGYAWREQLVYKQKFSSKSWFEESEHLEDYPKELIIEGITLEQAKELVETCDFTKPPIQEAVEVREELYEKPHYPNPKIPIKLADYKPGMTPVNKVEIAPGIIYIPVDKTAYIAMKAKGRARNYGDMLTRVLDIGSKYVVSDKLTVVKDAKYEFRIFDISFEDVKQLAKFNLSKDYDHKENKAAREDWRLNRKRPAPEACKPRPKLVPLNEVKLGDIVYLNSIDNQYKVLSKVELDGVPQLEVICVFNSERPSLVGEISYLKECYKVPADNIQIDPKFHKEEEEIITEDVQFSLRKKEQIYVPKEKPIVKKPDELTEDDFTAPPYRKISLDQIEPCDIITTNPHSRSAYEVVKHNGDHVIALCLYNTALPKRVGEEFYFKVPYLVEKASLSESLASSSCVAEMEASVSTKEKATKIPIAV